MDIQLLVAEYGWLALFVLSFVAATIVPLSSEVALLAGIAAGIPATEALVACSAGNCLACLVNYALGRFVRDKLQRKIEQSKSGRRALAWMERYGAWSLAGSWLPVVGDPLTIVAGLARVHPVVFTVVVCPLRVLRYVVLVWLAE